MVETNSEKANLLNLYFKYLLKKASNKLKKGISKLLGDEIDYAVYLLITNKEDFDFIKLPSIGVSGLKEYLDFEKKIKEFEQIVNSSRSESINFLYNLTLLKYLFPSADNIIEEALKEHQGKYFPIFKIIELLVSLKFISDKSFQEEYHSHFFDYRKGSHRLNLKELAVRIKRTDERARQLKDRHIKFFDKDFSFVRELDFHRNPYDIDIKGNIFEISPEELKKVNSNDLTNYTLHFIHKIFALMSKTHTLLYDEHRALTGEWNKSYLIKKHVGDDFRFVDFVSETYDKKNVIHRKGTELTSLSNLMFGFYNKLHLESDSGIVGVCKYLLLHELDITSANENEIVLKKTDEKYVWEYGYEALLHLGPKSKGHHINEILSFVRKKYPNVAFTENSLQSSIINKRETFISFNRTSCYGLLTWQNSNSNIKGGSIRKMVSEFLEKNNEPQHISVIAEYVLKFRPDTNEKSIMTSLRNEPHNLFSGKANFFWLTKNGNSSPKILGVPGSYFTQRALSRYTGWNYNDVVASFVKDGFSEVQIKALLEKKIANKYIILDLQDRLIVKKLNHQVPEDSNLEFKFIRQSENDVVLEEELKKTILKFTKEELSLELKKLRKLEHEHVTINQKVYKRSVVAIAFIKILRHFKCQICGYRILKKTGGFYIEAAHITPKHKGGTEQIENIILLCPNHHKEFDHGEVEYLFRDNYHIEFIINGRRELIILQEFD
ncbi:HNH endonuclease [Pedobacter frigidisoli]|uniref:HNH endonuclease n=1 Tax=Pedobacter frigidisoli TaxID=2530455 RepID=UPI00292CD256|nr:HNH endonuclease [Pedobacter frigidisoli]